MKLIPEKFINSFIPPSFLITFVPGLSERINEFEMTALIPISSSFFVFKNLTVDFVATGIKNGVSIFPDLVFKMAILADVFLSL